MLRILMERSSFLLFATVDEEREGILRREETEVNYFAYNIKNNKEREWEEKLLSWDEEEAWQAPETT